MAAENHSHRRRPSKLRYYLKVYGDWAILFGVRDVLYTLCEHRPIAEMRLGGVRLDRAVALRFVYLKNAGFQWHAGT